MVATPVVSDRAAAHLVATTATAPEPVAVRLNTFIERGSHFHPPTEAELLLQTLDPLSVVLKLTGGLISAYLCHEWADIESTMRLNVSLSTTAPKRATAPVQQQRPLRILATPLPPRNYTLPLRNIGWNLRGVEASRCLAVRETAGTQGSIAKGMPAQVVDRLGYFDVIYRELFERLKWLTAPFWAVGGVLNLHYQDFSTFEEDLQLFLEIQRLQLTWQHLSLCKDKAGGVEVAPKFMSQVEGAWAEFYAHCPNYASPGRVPLPLKDKKPHVEAAALVELRHFPLQFSIGLRFLGLAPCSCYFLLKQHLESATLRLDRALGLMNRAFPEYKAMAPYLARFCIEIMLELRLKRLDVYCDPPLSREANTAPEVPLVLALCHAGFNPYLRPTASAEEEQGLGGSLDAPDYFYPPMTGRTYHDEWRFWRIDLRGNSTRVAVQYLLLNSEPLFQPGALRVFRQVSSDPEEVSKVGELMRLTTVPARRV